MGGEARPGPSAIGFVGLGRMGRPMVERILERGHAVVVHDADPGACAGLAGATVAGDAREVADRCETVFSCVSTVDAYDAVALGPRGLAGGALIRTYVHLGTTGVAHIEGLAGTLAASGIETLDAPISGGVVGAVAGALASMVSGPATALDRARPVIDCYSRVVLNFGRAPGIAQAVKLINNNIATTNLMASIEGLAMAIRAGADPGKVADLIAAGTGSSHANDVIVRQQVVTRRFDWGGSLQIIGKDLRAWQALADRLAVACPLNRAAASLFVETIGHLDIDDDITDVARIIEGREGVRIGAGDRD